MFTWLSLYAAKRDRLCKRGSILGEMMDSATEAVETRASKKGIWSWILFDWAAQPFHTMIVTFVFAPYFASAVASNAAIGQSQWGYITGIAGVIIALMSPVLGAMADATGPRKPWIGVFSIIGVIGAFLLWFVTPGYDGILFPALAIILAYIGFEFAALFNNAMMPNLVPRAELGRLSGTSWGFGYLGGLVTLIVTLGLLAGSPETGKTLLGLEPLFGLDPAMREGDRASGPLTALWFAIFIIPMFLFTPDAPRRVAIKGAVSKAMRDLTQTIKTLPQQKSYFSFLLSSMFYRDALNALYAFGGIYAAGVLEWSITQIGIFGILANLTGAIGAWLGGKFDARFGPKIVVSWSIILLTIASITVIMTTRQSVFFIPLGVADSALPDLLFYVCGALIGAAGGSLQAASRTLLVDQVPRARVTEAFGLYALSGRATSFIGPISIALVTTFALTSMGMDSITAQRVGVVPVVVLFLIGLVLLPFVKSYRDKEAA